MKGTDKVSAVLAAAIALLVAVNCVVIYRVWLSGTEIADEMEKTELVFNDDTSVTNTFGRELWIRAKIILDEDRKGDQEIVSRAVEEGIWKEKGDGWYYYSIPLKSGERTAPLIDRLEESREGSGAADFRIQAEAVDEAWLEETPDSCEEAFLIFMRSNETTEQPYLL